MVNNSITTPQDFLDEITNYDFEQLVGQREEIEKRILNELILKINQVFVSLGAMFNPKINSYSLNDKSFRISLHYYQDTRILSIQIKSLNPSHHKISPFIPNIAPQQIISIESFGAIAYVEITYDSKEIEITLCELFERIIRSYLVRAYETIALTFDIAARRYSSLVLNRLYEIIDNQFVSDFPNFQKKEHYWLIVFNGNYGLFLYDAEFLRTAISKIRSSKNQIVEYSPYELTVALLTHELPYVRTLSHQAFFLKKKTMSLNFKKSGYASAANQLWSAIGAFQSFKDFTVYPVCEFNEYRLVVGFKSEFKSNFVISLDKVKQKLSTEFNSAISESIDYFSKIKGIIENKYIKQIEDTEYVLGHKIAPAELEIRTNTKINRNKIFLSYSHSDTVWLERLKACLRPIESRFLSLWSDNKIQPGEMWEKTLISALSESNAALLLISQEYFKSDYIWNHEYPLILGMKAKGNLRVFWIPLSSSLYSETDLTHIQALYPPLTPLDTLSKPKQKEALVHIAKNLIEVLKL